MKLYVLPVETACRGKCSFCITKFRQNATREILRIGDLMTALSSMEPEKIEITGGGDPSSHPRLEELIKICSKKTKTIMYTHGENLGKLRGLENLSQLAISMAHYDETENIRIMRVYPDLTALKDISVPIKFSLLLHKSGINNLEEISNYFEFVKNLADKVVVRQLFEHDYSGKMEGEFVSSQKMFEKLKIREHKLTKHGNPLINYKNLEVEFEYRSCACEKDNPVLHADGLLHKGWT